MPGALACCCVDTDHEGKGVRDLCVRGECVTVFPHFGIDCPERTTHVDVLLAVGAPPHLLGISPAARGTHDVRPGPIRIDAGEELPDAIGLVDARTPAPGRRWRMAEDPVDLPEGKRAPAPRFAVSFRKTISGGMLSITRQIRPNGF